MTTLEKIYKELAERFKDEPNKNLILGYTMGVLEKNKAPLVEELLQTKFDMPTEESMQRVFISENQEFVIDRQVFFWTYTNQELKQDILLNLKEYLIPNWTVTTSEEPSKP